MATESLFARIYATALPYEGTDAELARIVNGPGAVWLDRATDRALVMDSITGRRLLDGPGRINDMVRAGTLARDRMPLDAEVAIYVSPRKAAL